MTNTVVDFPGLTTVKGDAVRVLQKAIEAGMDTVIIVGFDKAGQEYFAANVSDAGEIIYHCERAKHRLMRVIDQEAYAH